MLPDYLSKEAFQDGRGLNPLLQNYWMTIHPPTLFLGFSSTLFPFVFAIAGLWRGDIKGWMRPAVPWAFFGVMILGTGILMGGAWAYEALGFGGFWAWDPVENASPRSVAYPRGFCPLARDKPSQTHLAFCHSHPHAQHLYPHFVFHLSHPFRSARR
jgi:cytochrome c-type biogenesis protein CcmF